MELAKIVLMYSGAFSLVLFTASLSALFIGELVTQIKRETRYAKEYDSD